MNNGYIAGCQKDITGVRYFNAAMWVLCYQSKNIAKNCKNLCLCNYVFHWKSTSLIRNIFVILYQQNIRNSVHHTDLPLYTCFLSYGQWVAKNSYSLHLTLIDRYTGGSKHYSCLWYHTVNVPVCYNLL